MSEENIFKKIQLVIIYITALNLIFTVCLNIGWQIKCTVECWGTACKYITCKRTPNLHPIYKDVQFLSQQRKLYNLKTHFIKFVLIILCLSVELTEMAWMCVSAVVFEALKSNNQTLHKLESSYPQCDLTPDFLFFNKYPYLVFLGNTHNIMYSLLFFLLSVLTRYLAARYLNHPFRRTLVNYLIWLMVEFFLIVCSSTPYTVVFSFLIEPLFGIINWLVLLRDNLILFRVLKSNLREIQFHSSNKVLYREQLIAFKLYRFFIVLLMFSLFLLEVSNILTRVTIFENSFSDINCEFYIVYGVNISIDPILSSHTKLTIAGYFRTVSMFVFMFYSVSTSFPLLCFTLLPLLIQCVKRYNARNNVYRYNYENMQPFLRRSN